ncbi:MAG: extracellular solute-binding protein, partial [Oscillospiraceae bacterium]|nr:extracellular solute-binding protein [Oscillospiraceae bacterium]
EYMKPDGTIEKAYKLNELFADEIGEMGYFYANQIDTDKDGNIYLFTGQRVFILDKDMNKLSTVESDQYLNQSVRLKDGTVAAVIMEGGMVDGPILYRDGAVADRKVVTPGRPITPGGGEDTKTTKTVLPIDPKTGKLGEALNVPYETVYSQLYTGGGDYDVYAYMNTSVFGIKLGKGENMGTFEELFNLLNLDIDGSNLYVMAVQSDGGVVGITSTYSESDDGGESFETFKVEKVKSSTVPYKTVLTLATMDTWSIKNAILKFNRNSDKYRIQVADYSQYNTEEDYSAGNTKLTAELLAGKVPDLIYTIGMPIDHLGAKGYLENLWPFIEKDTELGGRSGLVQPVFNALQSRDGKLYQLVSSFYVQTMAGPSSMVGTKMGWTVQELLNAYRQLPEGATIADIGFTKSQMLDGICSLMLDGFVNWDAGKTDFDNADFIGLLEFVNTFPADFNWEEYYGEDYVYESQGQRFARGGQLITELTVSNMLSWRTTEVNLGGDMTFVGYPVASGVGSGFVLQGGYAMSSTCKNKDAAWSFLRTFLTKEYQQSQGSWTMPTNKAVFDQRIEEAKTPRYRQDEKGEYQLDENGQRIEIPRGYGDGYTDKDGNWINTPYYHLTDEQAQKIIDLVNATTHVMTYDEDVLGIIADECSGLFAGTRTAAQTAKMIQSRLNLYVGEQK